MSDLEKRMIECSKDDGNFGVWYDDDQAKNYMFVKIPLGKLAADHVLGTIIGRGFLDQLKAELLAWIRALREEGISSSSKILRPSDAVPSATNLQGLKVL